MSMFNARPKRVKKTPLATEVKSAPKKEPVLPKTVLNQVRDSMRDADRGLGSLYFEARVTADTNTSSVNPALAERHEFASRADGDLYFRASKLERVKEQLVNFVTVLRNSGVTVHRYWIVEVMIDSNNFDTLKLL